jgi:uncharacterized protein DUF6709
MDTWIHEMVRTVSRRRAAAWTLGLLALLLIPPSNQRYLGDFLHGPFPLGENELSAIGDLASAPHTFARIAADRVIDTGVRQYTTHTTGGVETSREVSGAYYAFAVGERFLIVKSKDKPGNTAAGELQPWPPELAEHLFADTNALAVRPRFYSFYVSNAPFRFPGYLYLGITAVFALLYWWKARPAWRFARDPSGHPLVKRLTAWGDALGVAVAAEREHRTSRIKAGSGWRLGEKYLVRKSFFHFDVLRFDDLLWAYKKVTKHSVNFIPTGKTYQGILACTGGTAIIAGNEPHVDAMLAHAAARAPWAIHGFNADLDTLFRKQPAEFVKGVAQRRAEWANRSG